jgi:hypothetical protein
MSIRMNSVRTRHEPHELDDRVALGHTSSSNIVQSKESYTNFIKACYEAYPGAFRYYEELVEYINTSVDESQIASNLPKVFEALGLAEARDLPSRRWTRWWSQCALYDLNKQQHAPKIAVVEGLPSPEAISLLGSTFYARPEFFIGHLELYKKQIKPEGFFELPTISSRREGIIHIRTINIMRALVDSDDGIPMEQRRASAFDSCRQTERNILIALRYGSTRIRRINVHSKRIFSFEQLVSVCASVDPSAPGRWQGIQTNPTTVNNKTNSAKQPSLL